VLTIIIPFKDKPNLLKKCINRIANINPLIPLELLLINNNSIKKKTYQVIKNLYKIKIFKNINIINTDDPFNYSKAINNAVFSSKYDKVLLLNNDVFITCNNWGIEICDLLENKNFGCIGIKLLNPDNSIQHVGINLDFKYGAREITDEPMFNEKYKNINYVKTKAVTSAFMAIRKEVFIKLGGMNEYIFPLTFNDVHLSLKAYESGLQNLCITNLTAIHKRSSTRKLMKSKMTYNFKRRLEKVMIKIRILYHYLKNT